MKHLQQIRSGIRTGVVCLCASFGLMIGWAPSESGERGDHRIKPGEMMPSYVLSGHDGRQLGNEEYKDKVLVMVYVVAKQRGSERAIADADKVVSDLDDDGVELIFVTPYDEQRAYFESFWDEKHIKAELVFDPDRKLYADLGLIAFPTTLIVDEDGKLEHRLSTHSSNYPHVLDGYIRHTLGLIDDAGLEEHLKARSLPTSSDASVASRHRAVAQLMRHKEMYETAEKELLEAIQIDPENFDIRLDLADLYLYLGNTDKAYEYIIQVREHDVKNRNAMLLEGIYLFRKGNYVKAQQILAQALVLNSDPARAHYYLGRVYESVGRPEDAMYHYRQALVRLLDEPAE